MQLKFHYVGIHTNKKLPKKDFITEGKYYASGYFDNPCGVDYLKFDDVAKTIILKFFLAKNKNI